MRMVGLHMPFAAERRDRHRRFTLTINLHKALPHDRDGLANVCEIHRPATIDDGAETSAVFAAALGSIDPTAHHGRGPEHHGIIELTGEVEYFVRIETAGLRHDVPPAHAGVRKIIKASAVR